MLSLRTLVALFVPVAVLAAQDPSGGLFDGKTLNGWSGDPRYWSVDDGAIVGRTTAEAPLKSNTFLVHDGEVANFELRFRFKLTGGNSGVQYRSRDLGEHVVAGYQADMEAGENYTGILYEERGRGILARRGERVVVDADGVRKVAEIFGQSAELQKAVRPGEWNDYLIRAQGAHLVHEINGTRMVDVLDESPGAARRGCLALQLHAGPPMEVRYRDFQLRELPEPVSSTLPVEWIWSVPDGAATTKVWFRKSFVLKAPVAAGRILATCDNQFTLFVDGKKLLSGKDWSRLESTTAVRAIPAGEHVLAIAAVNEGGPAGLVVRADFDLADGTHRTVVSDGSWRASSDVDSATEWNSAAFEDHGWPLVHSFGKGGTAGLSWPDHFSPRVATAAETLTLRPGYRVELVKSAQIGEGSWIALGFDQNGDALVSVERESLARIRIGTGGDYAFEPLPETPRGSMGFCVVDGVLFAQGDGPGNDGKREYGLYRLRDADGDGHYEDVTLLKSLGNGGEHGAHGVVLGPDHKLYMMNGNHSRLPEGLAATSPHASWAEDVLLPTIEDPRGHANGIRAPGGHLLRTDFEGKEWEIVGAGFRNAYDFTFGPAGEVITFDSDMEWDLGLPWYRPTRVNHVVSGAEFGWRTGSGKWSATFPDSLPAIVDVGLSSPTGLVYGAAAHFPLRDRQAVYIADWAYGRILAVRLEPDGATFRGSFENFVTGKPLNVTDLAVGPDGALWFTTGGRGTQSGLYRVTWTGEGATDAPLPAVADPGGARAKRHELEQLHGHPDRARAALPKILVELGSKDRFIRYAARVALEFVPVGLWSERAVAMPPSTAAATALLALARKGEDADRDEVLRRLGAFTWLDMDRDARIDWLRVHQVALVRRTAPVGEELRLAIGTRLDPHYPTGDFELDRALLHVLVAVGDDTVVGRALERLEQLEPKQGIDIAFALRLLPTGFGKGDRERLFRWLGRAKTADGGASFGGFLGAIERDALAHVAEADRDALKALAAPPPRTRPDLSAFGQNARAWTVAELEPLLSEVGHDRNFERGQQAFTKAICVTCHRFDGNGGAVGPDLTAVASRFTRRDLVRAIVEPSADVSDQYQYHVVTLRDGTTKVGRIVRDDANALELIVDPYTDKRETMRPADVVSKVASPVSPMPPGLLGILSVDEVLDLFAYLESGGNRSSPAFKQ